MKVSVIIPVYNASGYLDETLKSVLNQNFEDYEVILIDDGSTDDSLKIAEKLLNDSEISSTVFSQKNHGVSHARNKGIELANGDYLVFVDDDDKIDKNHLSNLYNGDTDFSLTQIVKVDENGNYLSEPYKYSQESIKTTDFIKDELQMKLTFSFTQLMYKKEIITKNNIRFNTKRSYGEDTEFALKALIYGETIAISNQVTYFYLQHENQATSTLAFKRFEFIEILEDLAKLYEEKGYNDLSDLILTNRIPMAIFGNMNYFLFNNYDPVKVLSKMEELDFFDKLKRYKGNFKFSLKVKLFLLNPKLYIKIWKKFKNNI